MQRGLKACVCVWAYVSYKAGPQVSILKHLLHGKAVLNCFVPVEATLIQLQPREELSHSVHPISMLCRR